LITDTQCVKRRMDDKIFDPQTFCQHMHVNISGSAGRIFTILTSNESFLDVDDRSGSLFNDISRDIAMATDFVQK